MRTKEELEQIAKDVLKVPKDKQVELLAMTLNSLHSEGMRDAGSVANDYMAKRNFLLREEVYGVVLDAIRNKPPV